MSDAPPDPTRRRFLTRTGSVVSGSWLAWSLPAVLSAADFACRAAEENRPFAVLSPEEAVEVEAIAEQILPGDDTPGAKEAGVVYFIDRALETFLSFNLEIVRSGLEDLRTRIPGKAGFSDLDFDTQHTLLEEIEDSPFFQVVRFLTIAGMLAHPSYGGNRDQIGWRLIGFEARHAWQPPFGAYETTEPQSNEGGQA